VSSDGPRWRPDGRIEQARAELGRRRTQCTMMLATMLQSDGPLLVMVRSRK